MEEYRLIAEKLLQYDNVRLYCFPVEDVITTDLDNYTDYTHHSPEIAHRLLEYMETGHDEIKTLDDMDSAITKIKSIAVNYDYDALLTSYSE